MSTTCGLQWKGTDVCLDLWCECGHQSHLDGYFVYHVRCPNCGVVYKMPGEFALEPVEPGDDDLVAMDTSLAIVQDGVEVGAMHSDETARRWDALKRIPSYQEAREGEATG